MKKLGIAVVAAAVILTVGTVSVTAAGNRRQAPEQCQYVKERQECPYTEEREECPYREEKAECINTEQSKERQYVDADQDGICDNRTSNSCPQKKECGQMKGQRQRKGCK